jgi:hypothetical protein
MISQTIGPNDAALSNRQKTIIAGEMMQRVNDIIDDPLTARNLGIAKRISRTIPLDENIFGSGSIADFYGMDIWNDYTKEYVRIDMSNPSKLESKIYNALIPPQKLVDRIGSVNQAMNNLLYSAIDDMQKKGIFGESYLDNLTKLAQSAKTTNPWFVASELASSLRKTYLYPLRDAKYTYDNYVNGDIIGDELLDSL